MPLGSGPCAGLAIVPSRPVGEAGPLHRGSLGPSEAHPSRIRTMGEDAFAQQLGAPRSGITRRS
eukprot:13785555-Alexandrium_andersonii.AAC.1